MLMFLLIMKRMKIEYINMSMDTLFLFTTVYVGPLGLQSSAFLCAFGINGKGIYIICSCAQIPT